MSIHSDPFGKFDGAFIDRVASYIPGVSTVNVGINLLELAIMNAKGTNPKDAYLHHVKNKSWTRLLVEAIPFGNFAGLARDIRDSINSKSSPPPPREIEMEAFVSDNSIANSSSFQITEEDETLNEHYLEMLNEGKKTVEENKDNFAMAHVGMQLLESVAKQTDDNVLARMANFHLCDFTLRGIGMMAPLERYDQAKSYLDRNYGSDEKIKNVFEGDIYYYLGQKYLEEAAGSGNKAQLEEKAFDCYTKAAEKGINEAHEELAKCYNEGIGTAINLAEASKHAQSALNLDQNYTPNPLYK